MGIPNTGLTQKLDHMHLSHNVDSSDIMEPEEQSAPSSVNCLLPRLAEGWLY